MFGRAEIDRGALVSILCTCVGTGILQLPLTLAQGGWLCVALIFLVAAVTNTTGRWLIKCLYSDPINVQDGLAGRLNDYPAVGEAAFGLCGRLTAFAQAHAVRSNDDFHGADRQISARASAVVVKASCHRRRRH